MLFRSSSLSVIKECQKHFNFLPITALIDIKTAKFLQKILLQKIVYVVYFTSKLIDNLATPDQRQTLSSGCHIHNGTYLTLSLTLTITLTLLTLPTVLTLILGTVVNISK